MDARLRIEAMAASWRRRWSMAFAACGASLLGALVTNGVAVPIALSAAAIASALLWWRRPVVEAKVVARHLDRTFPALEESSELLLAPVAGLSPMQQVQRARATSAFASLPPELRLPQRATNILWGISALLTLVAISGMAIVSEDFPGLITPIGVSADSPPEIGDVRLTITAPAYLGGTTSTVTGDGEAPEGAALSFAAEVRGADDVVIVTINGDSLPISGTRGAELSAERSFLYQVVARRDSFRVVGEWHRVTVLPDRPPLLTVVRPEERTTLPATPPWRVPVEILASDDHRVAEVRLIATITTGSGEGVRFREDTLPFTTREPRGTGLLLRAELDLARLGMGPGDELYLSAQAWDGRRPVPNEGRSATLFISITDTTQVMEAEFDGLAIDRMPDYFRSQRQIIIDTEKLLAERARISEAEFKRRSNDIGIDQQLLRLRYSEVAGEESSPEGEPMGGREHMAQEPEDPNAAAVAAPNARTQADLTVDQGHSHDIAENATLLARSTKELLNLALGQMWQSELQLRTYKPDSALPFERRALEYLELVRQAARTYVKRVGLEPPPLEPDRKRLTGKLDGIGSARPVSRVAARDSLPAIRALLAGSIGLGSLEAAEREVAVLAAVEPSRHLATLREIAEIRTALRNGTPCAECEARLRRALLAALPTPAPSATTGAATPPVAAGYFDRMRRP